MRTTDTQAAAEILSEMFPGISGIKDGALWGETGAVHLGDAAEGGLINGTRAADYYGHRMFHPELPAAVEALGYYLDWYDAGTLLAYPA